MKHNNKCALAYAVFRVSIGFCIFVHGIARFGSNYEKFIDTTIKMFDGSIFPQWLVQLHAHLIPILEVFVGCFLILGAFTQIVALIGLFLMLTLILGSGLLQKWEVVNIQMNYVLFYFIILFLIEYNNYSFDQWRRKKNLGTPRDRP